MSACLPACESECARLGALRLLTHPSDSPSFGRIEKDRSSHVVFRPNSSVRADLVVELGRATDDARSSSVRSRAQLLSGGEAPSPVKCSELRLLQRRHRIRCSACSYQTRNLFHTTGFFSSTNSTTTFILFKTRQGCLPSRRALISPSQRMSRLASTPARSLSREPVEP